MTEGLRSRMAFGPVSSKIEALKAQGGLQSNLDLKDVVDYGERFLAVTVSANSSREEQTTMHQ